jgi:4-hydroxy-tetrahydrodipicolinate reductase
MSKLNIGLIGYGKMGKTIEKLAIKKNHEIILRISSKEALELSIPNLKALDVAIEFSRPESAIDNLRILANKRIPTICGTTGWLESYNDIKNLFIENDTPFLYASNFSVGVNILFEINKKLAKVMNRFSEYNVEIMESHHIEKKDAPSGTAITIAEQILENIDRKNDWQNSKSTDSSLLDIESVREADVKGYHEINYVSAIDKISLSHEAYSREGFAMGALLSAEWIVGKTGIYQFADVMKNL